MSEKIRKIIKDSVFTFDEIALILNVPRTSFYRHLREDSLSTKELLEIINILGLSDEEVLKLIRGN